MTTNPESTGPGPPSLEPPRAAAGNALAVASMLAWSTGFPAAEILLETWPPLTLIAARLLLAVALLMPLWALADGLAVLRLAHWRRGAFVGGLGFGMGAWLLLVAQSLTDPVTVALIASASPVAATLMEMGRRGRRLSINFSLGLAATVLGGAVATSALAPAQLGPGAGFAIVSVFLFAWGSMATVRDFPDLTPIGRTTITLAGGAVAVCAICLAAMLAGHDLVPSRPVSGNQVGLLAIYAVAGMALSQVLWIASVGRLGIAVASFHINAAPFYVMLIMISLGGGWSWPQVAGAAIVGLGVVLSQRRRALFRARFRPGPVPPRG